MKMQSNLQKHLKMIFDVLRLELKKEIIISIWRNLNRSQIYFVSIISPVKVFILIQKLQRFDATSVTLKGLGVES